MCSAKNLQEYLISHLLLDEQQQSSRSFVSRSKSIRPIISVDGINNERELMLPLLQYQRQLEALGAALWAFQQDNYSQCVDSTIPNCSGAPTTKDNNETSKREEDHYHLKEGTRRMAFTNSSARRKWWNQVKALSTTCQTLEAEIGNRLFSTSEDSTGNTEGIRASSDDLRVSRNSSNALEEVQSYEHNEDEEAPNYEQRRSLPLKTTKTLVFSGKGSKEKQLSRKKKSMHDDNPGSGGFQTQDHSPSVPIPIARDTFTEQLLVRELQNRIRSVAALREEEQQVDLSAVEFQAMGGEEEDRSLQEAMAADEDTVDSVDAFHVEKFRPGDGTRMKANEIGFRDRVATSNIFLGASGSLLDELKRNISPDFHGDNPEDRMDHEEAVDSTTDDLFYAS
jgi:hypothetical protein